MCSSAGSFVILRAVFLRTATAGVAAGSGRLPKRWLSEVFEGSAGAPPRGKVVSAPQGADSRCRRQSARPAQIALREGLLRARTGREPDQGRQTSPRLRPHLIQQGGRKDPFYIAAIDRQDSPRTSGRQPRFERLSEVAPHPPNGRVPSSASVGYALAILAVGRPSSPASHRSAGRSEGIGRIPPDASLRRPIASSRIARKGDRVCAKRARSSRSSRITFPMPYSGCSARRRMM